MSFEPKILGILCNWCAYAGGDLAGVSRIQYLPNIRVVRVMCSGRVDPEFVVRAFLKGCDGIWVGGCHPADCHYISGNREAVNMVNLVRRILKHLKINTNRLILEWVSAAEGARFAEVINNFTNQIRELGPLASDAEKGVDGLKRKLEAALSAVTMEKLRWVTAKQTEFRRDGNRYGEVFTGHEIGRMLDGFIQEEITAQEILLLLRQEALSVKEIAHKLELPPPYIMSMVYALRKKDHLILKEIRHSSPLYAANNN
ncbi:MAG: hydrogenase iron-sulfur subunit [Desulfobacterium sp.]|nr:hydrogenase iron-sulfur subunit [Desulfobacterium sp.]MBU3949745.1 hydrogenase iron-sulfur subunit [Pseudomonadota bacterium]MBU4010351.1 hydrogenase iron-sulfur subunit [Pseudomonadota bacterium]MBU4036652.1 hydrogenase iron-sulfur subunit [Pseudomonadota bacterium]